MATRKKSRVKRTACRGAGKVLSKEGKAWAAKMLASSTCKPQKSIKNAATKNKALHAEAKSIQEASKRNMRYQTALKQAKRKLDKIEAAEKAAKKNVGTIKTLGGL